MLRQRGSKWVLTAALVIWMGLAQAQSSYVPPADSSVAQKLSAWQDLKFGLLMHWGTYCQWGVVESWSICPEDEGWTQRSGPYSANYFDYKRAYEKLQTTFNPYYFEPEKWVEAAKDAGMRYVVFTTKHHDGFCMFDTKQTDYKVTSSKTPFASNPRANVTKEIFDAFRKEHFMIGAYFSKADWHNENYWWPYFPPKDRNVNYDPEKYPARWQAFKDFTFRQIQELMTDYGRVDILWLDGGWVRPRPSTEGKSMTEFGKYNQDIDMPKIASMARNLQHGLIIVDRSVGGEFENYQTPEQQIPAQPLSYPWETCMTMGNSWSFVPGDHYKTASQLVSILVKIVSRGGNLLLNIGPGPEGDWDTTAYRRLNDIGQWMRINGEGIYASRPVAPYSSGNYFYTRSKDSRTVYAFLLSDSVLASLPGEVTIPNFPQGTISMVNLLGSSEKLRFKQQDGNLMVTMPENIRKQVEAAQPIAITFRVQR